MENLKINKKLDNRQLFSLLFYALILGITSVAFSSCSTQRGIRLRDKSIKEWNASEWQSIKKSSDKEAEKWTIYSRKLKDTSFLEYKIEGEVKASPNAFIDWFKQDLYDLANGSKSKKYPVYDIVAESKDSLLTYVIHNEPFPLKDTEMSVRYVFLSDEDGSTGVKWKEVWNESSIQPLKKLKRIETFRGSWSLSPVANNSCKVLTSVQFNPKGMPTWLFEPMVFKFLRNGLDDFRANVAN